MTNTVTFTVYGPPRPKERARVCKDGRVFTPQRTRQYESAIRSTGAMHVPRGWSLAGAFFVELTFVFADRRRVDVDNVCKAALDGLNGVTWKDDSQVRRVMCEKTVGPVERTEVRVTRLLD